MFENFPWYAWRWFSDLSGDFLKRISLLQTWFNQGPLWMSEMCHSATPSANPPGLGFVKLNATLLFVRLNAINIFLGVAFTFVCYILQSSISKKTWKNQFFLSFGLALLKKRAILRNVTWEGRIAQLVRASRWHREGHRFEFCYAHHFVYQGLAG